jgi:hypothetical protein
MHSEAMSVYQSGIKAERDRVIAQLTELLRREPIDSERGAALRDLYRRLYGASVITRLAEPCPHPLA